MQNENNLMIHLTPAQQAAYDDMRAFAERKTDSDLMVLEGYAGVGKTVVVGKLVADLQDEFVIGVAAPTNKAVKVLREKLVEFGVHRFGSKRPRGKAFEQDEWDGGLSGGGRVLVGTIHSFLGLQMKERDDGTQECKKERDATLHNCHLLVVDEASMIGTEMFKMILNHRRDCLVLFVGDPAQLPPVDAKSSLSPVFEHVERKVRLTEVVRQARDNPVIRLSMVIRRFIETDRRMTLDNLMESIPETRPCHVGVVQTVPEDVAEWCIAERKDGRDCRILAFTNARVEFYNRMVHEALYGPIMNGASPFSVGETVIVHSACDAALVLEEMINEWAGVEAKSYITEPYKLHTSQELTLRRIERGERNRYYQDIPADRLFLDDGSGNEISVYVPHDWDEVNRRISELFNESRDLRLEVDGNKTLDQQSRERMVREYKSLSGRAWALKGAFAPIRHAYALTTHKSQGSTFDTTLVDYRDLNRMKEPSQFNRALYVACTRSREYLAVCA